MQAVPWQSRKGGRRTVLSIKQDLVASQLGDRMPETSSSRSNGLMSVWDTSHPRDVVEVSFG